MYKLKIPKYIRSKQFRNVILTYIASIVNLFLSFVVLTLILREIGIDIYGKFTIIISSAGFLLNIISIRTGEAVVRFVKYEMEKNNLKKVKFFLFLSFVIDIIIGILFLLLVFIFSKFLALWFLKDSRYFVEMNLFAFVTFFTILRGTSFGFLLALERFNILNILNISEQLVRLLIIIFLFYIFSINISLRELIYVYIFASIFITFLYHFIFFRFYYTTDIRSGKLELNKNWFLEYKFFVVKTFTSTLLKAGNQNVDNLIFAHFTDPSVVGFYDILKKIFFPISLVANTFSHVYYPKMVEIYARREKIGKFIFRRSVLIGLLLFLYSIIVLVFKDYIFIFLGIKNLNYFYPLFLLALILTITQALFWWVRNFSNTVNPNYSIIANFIAFFTYVLIILALKFNMVLENFIKSLCILLILSHLIVNFYWIYVFYNYINKENLNEN